MKAFLGTLCLCLIVLSLSAQIDPATIESDLDSLFTLSKKEFKPIIDEKSYEEGDQTFYHASFTPSGGKDAKVSIDSENSRSYYLYFDFSTATIAKAEFDKLAKALENVGAKHSLTRKDGTDIKYQNFKAVRVEFNSDNIDVLGKHPAFTIGILKNSNTIELVLNEPLWK